ncbi:MAG: class I SAM-dependent methyltransferase [Thermodesulfobacteriota bacterium]
MKSHNISYEESVRWLQSQPEYKEFVKLCYLDENTYEAAERFSKSEEFNEVVKLLLLDKTQNRMKILDMGCGNGIASYAFAVSGHDVYSVDPERGETSGLIAAKKLSKEVKKGSIKLIQAFAESLPFKHNSFDIVYARQALHHFFDLETGLQECARVIKKGGILIATREHIVDNNEQLKCFLDNHILHQIHGGENAYPLNRYIISLKKSGFKISKLLLHYQTVINHFPESNQQLKNNFEKSLAKIFGKKLSLFIARVSLLEYFYRKKLSKIHNFSGRFNTFICKKV